MKEFLQGLIEHLDETDKDYVYLIGDTGSLDLTVKEDVKKVEAEGLYPAEIFEAADDVRDISRGANIALTNTIAVPRSILSEKGNQLLDGEIDAVEANSDG